MGWLSKRISLLGAGAATVLLPFAFWASIHHAPVEVQMGIVQKIFYLHLPVALGSFALFFLNFVASILYLVRRRDGWDALALAAAEVGMICATLTLLTGSLWARPIWNTWWNWEPRLTTMLILWFLYLGYFVLRGSLEDPRRRAKFAAIWGLVAFADVPLVYFSVHLFERQLHPVVKEPGQKIALDPAMVDALNLGLIAFGFLFLSLVWLRYRIGLLEMRAEDRAWSVGH